MSQTEALATIQPSVPGELSVHDVLRQATLIQNVMQAVMKRDTHYGIIPGCNKPSLYKPGAEKLCLTFRLAPEFSTRQTDLPHGHREYHVTCALRHIPTGAALGQGEGSCSTMESKYRYRNGDAFEVTDEKIPQDAKDNKAAYRKKGYGMKKVEDAWVWVRYTGSGEKVENPDPADLYNTALKMANKRALVAAVLVTTGASDIFTQDVEDLMRKADDFPTDDPPAPKPSNGSAAPTGGGKDRRGLEGRIAKALKDPTIEPIVRATIEKAGHKGKTLKSLSDADVFALDLAIEAAVNEQTGNDAQREPGSDDGSIPF